MKAIRLFPRSMVARLSFVLVIALTVELAGTMLLNRWQERELISAERTERIVEQLRAAEQVASHVDPLRRPRVLAEMTIEGLALNWVPRTVITDSTAGHTRLMDVKSRIEQLVPQFAARDLRLNLIPSDEAGGRDLLGALRLGDGSFLTFRIRPFLASPPPLAVITLLHLALIAAVLGIALLMVRALVRPLRDLADAADATGRGSFPALPATGPREVRRVAAAFAAMQSRLLQMVEDHSQALVAVSHDLRTPIQRLRLRTSQIEDEGLREAVAADLSDMEKFIGAVVGFLQDGSEEEERLIDLPSLLMTMVDNARDAGAQIDYDGPEQLQVRIRSLALKRAIGNLIDNACRHAEHVRVSITLRNAIIISVDDDGPGIPPDRREEALMPFRRLHGKAGGGAGLGLAIANKAVASFGGRLLLDDSADYGGLAATIEIPLPAVA